MMYSSTNEQTKRHNMTQRKQRNARATSRYVNITIDERIALVQRAIDTNNATSISSHAKSNIERTRIMSNDDVTCDVRHKMHNHENDTYMLRGRGFGDNVRTTSRHTLQTRENVYRWFVDAQKGYVK